MSNQLSELAKKMERHILNGKGNRKQSMHGNRKWKTSSDYMNA
jgi:hypothetical protein